VELHSHQELSEIALHNRVRSPTNPHSVEIKGLDHKFWHSPNAVQEADIQRFVKALMAAELYELQNADIILCTCSTAGAPRLTRKFHRVWSENANLVSILHSIVQVLFGGVARLSHKSSVRDFGGIYNAGHFVLFTHQPSACHLCAHSSEIAFSPRSP